MRLYVAGWRPVDIARLIGTSEWTVHYRLKRQGVEKHNGRTPAHVAAEARLLHEGGMSIRQISRRLNRDPRTIKKLIG